MTPRSSQSRSGFTLVESLTTMVLLSAFLAIGCSLVRLMLSVESGDREHLELIETTARLSRSFRADVHEAGHAILFPEGPGVPSVLVLEMPDGRVIRYETGAKRLLRVEEFAEVPLHADTFDLGGRVVHASIDESPGATLVALAFDRRKTARREDPRPIHIEAALGLDQRFRRSSTEDDQ